MKFGEMLAQALMGIFFGDDIIAEPYGSEKLHELISEKQYRALSRD